MRRHEASFSAWSSAGEWHGLPVEMSFTGPSGRVTQLPWEQAAGSVRFEELAPVSAFPTIPGRRWGPGLWWSATTGRHVAAGSNAMRTQLMVLDRDPEVTGLAGRPVRLLWRTRRGQVRSWTPQLFARYRDGTALLADCPSHPGAGGERALNAADVMAQACADVGWTYRRLQPLGDVLAANLKWLAGYRHPRNAGPPGQAAALLEAFARPRPLLEGTEAVGDPLTVLPAVFHALWHQRLTTPLRRPLHERAIVTAGPLHAATAPAPAEGPRPSGRRRPDGGDHDDASSATAAGPTPGSAPASSVLPDRSGGPCLYGEMS